MSGKATAVAPANIAFIKYWGTKDLESTLPYNPSLSMTLSRCVTRTTVEREPDGPDEVLMREAHGDLAPAPEAFARPVVRHLERLKAWAGAEGGLRVATENSFPMGTGMASSASGFAALTLATVAALDCKPSIGELSALARRSGSGSAARSVMGGYVIWPGGGGDRSEAAAVAPAEHWALRDVIAVLDGTPKEVSSREGHARAPSSPYFETRLRLLPDRLAMARRAIEARDFMSLAPVVEEEAIDLHLIAMSSRPPIFYWEPGTVEVLRLARRLRAEGVEVCATMDAGANVHLICTPPAEERVVAALTGMPAVRSVIRDGVGGGAAISAEHLL